MNFGTAPGELVRNVVKDFHCMTSLLNKSLFGSIALHVTKRTKAFRHGADPTITGTYVHNATSQLTWKCMLLNRFQVMTLN